MRDQGRSRAFVGYPRCEKSRVERKCVLPESSKSDKKAKGRPFRQRAFGH